MSFGHQHKRTARQRPAARAAKVRGIHVLVLTGKDGGTLAFADVEVRCLGLDTPTASKKCTSSIHAWIDAIEQAH